VVLALRGREDELTEGRTLFTSLRLEHADSLADAVSNQQMNHYT